jgi:hypothetical protein
MFHFHFHFHFHFCFDLIFHLHFRIDLMFHLHFVVVKESELYVILYKLSNHKEKGGGRNYPDPRQLDDSVTDTRTPQVRLCYI